jgi:hypothetical protein
MNSTRELRAVVLTVIGAAVGAAALFVDYWYYASAHAGITMISRAHLGASLAFSSGYVMDTALILAIAVTSLFWRSAILWAAASAFAADVLITWTGQTLVPGIDGGYIGDPSIEIGSYLGIAGAAIALLGGLLGVADALTSARVDDTNGRVAGGATTLAGFAPAGWFPDPAGAAELRRWDGRTWTNETSSSGSR